VFLIKPDKPKPIERPFEWNPEGSLAALCAAEGSLAKADQISHSLERLKGTETARRVFKRDGETYTAEDYLSMLMREADAFRAEHHNFGGPEAARIALGNMANITYAGDAEPSPDKNPPSMYPNYPA
jgi:hypothetical protein